MILCTVRYRAGAAPMHPTTAHLLQWLAVVVLQISARVHSLTPLRPRHAAISLTGLGVADSRRKVVGVDAGSCGEAVRSPSGCTLSVI